MLIASQRIISLTIQNCCILIVVYFDLILGPSFVKEMRNVSIAVGRDATIDCHVSNAEDYKVITFHLQLLSSFNFYKMNRS